MSELSPEDRLSLWIEDTVLPHRIEENTTVQQADEPAGEDLRVDPRGSARALVDDDQCHTSDPLDVRVGEAEAVCYATLSGSLVVRANGRVGKRTQVLDPDRNDIGHIASDSLLHLRPGALNDRTLGWWTGDAIALKCPRHAKVAA